MAKISNDVMGYEVVANNEVKMFNNVDDVVNYVVMMFKKHPNNAVYVNGMRLRLEKTKDYKWSVVLVDADKEWVAGYVMGKIKRGLADAVAYCVSRIEIDNDMEENNMNDMTGIDENGFAIDGLAYVNENMERVDVDMIKDCIEECVEDLCLAEDGKRMDFEGFCDVLWTNYVWDRVLDSGCTDESLEIETRYVMEFNDRVRYIVEHDFDMLYVNCYDEIGVDDMVKNSSPCLDDVDIELANDRLADWLVERANGSMGDYFTDVTKNMWDYSRDDIDEDRLKEILFEKVDGLVDVEFTEPDDDRNIVRIWFDRPIKKKRQDSVKVAKVIKDYVDNYEGMLMDYNGYGASICVPWDVFNEDDMKMLIEDDEFEAYVDQYLMKTNIYDMLVYDDGVYVSVDADMFEKVA